MTAGGPSPLEVVSAGAGTGKTYQVTEVVAQALLAGELTPDQVAVITFTEAAAAELQARLKSRLHEGGRPELAAQVDAAYISTIHGFCLRLLRENPIEAGLGPGPETLGEEEQKLLVQRAVARVLAADPRLAEETRFLLLQAFRGRGTGKKWQTGEQKLEEAVQELVDRARGLRKDGGALLALAEENDRELGERLAGLDPLTAGQIRSGLQEALAAWDAWARAHAHLTFQYAEQSRAAADRLRRICAERCPSVEELLGFHPGSGGRDNGHEEAAGRLKEACLRLAARHPAEHARLRRVVRGLFTLAARALSAYQEEKEAQGFIDFTDMESRALALLEHRRADLPFVRYLQAKVRLLVVDEFQDTSPIQFALVEALRGGGRLRAVYVGDLKQAIYGFRDADHSLLAALLGEGGGTMTRRALTRNWRSRPELVRFANALFPGLFAAHGREVERLEPASPYARGEAELPGPALAVWTLPERGNRARRFAAVAGRIARLLQQGEPTWDPRLGRLRPLEYRDVAVLARTNPELEEMAAALARCGVPAVRERAGFFASVAYGLCRALLACLANPADTRSLAAVLVSERVGLSQASLLELGRAGLLERWPAAARRLARGERGRPGEAAAGLSPSEAAALERFARQWTRWARLLRESPLEEACERILAESELAACLGSARGAQDEANVERFLELVHAFAGLSPAQRGRLGIGPASPEGLLAYLDQLTALGDADRQPTPSLGERGGVHLSTVHKAKGLEFPVVVWVSGDQEWLPRLPRLETVREAGGVLGAGLLARTRLRYVPSTKVGPLAQVLLEDARDPAREEALRHLYVAFTRARERLVIVQGPPRPSGRENTYDGLLAAGGFAVDPGAQEVRVGGDCFAAVVEELAVPSQEELDEADARAGQGAPGPGEGAAAPAPAAAGPEAEPRVLRRLAPSELSDYLDCPAQYELVHRLGVAYRGTSRGDGPPVTLHSFAPPLEPPAFLQGPAPIHREHLGKLVHHYLFLLDPAVGAGEGQAGELAARLAAQLLPEGPAEAAGELAGYLREVGGRTCKALVLGRTLEAQREFPFLLPVAGTTVEGVIDLAVRRADGWHLYDYKLAAGSGEAALRALSAHYRPQLETYALAWEEGIGEPVRGLHLLFLEQGVAVSWEPAPAGQTRAQVAAVAAGVALERFDREPERRCSRCVYARDCTRKAEPAVEAGTD